MRSFLLQRGGESGGGNRKARRVRPISENGVTRLEHLSPPPLLLRWRVQKVSERAKRHGTALFCSQTTTAVPGSVSAPAPAPASLSSLCVEYSSKNRCEIHWSNPTHHRGKRRSIRDFSLSLSSFLPLSLSLSVSVSLSLWFLQSLFRVTPTGRIYLP